MKIALSSAVSAGFCILSTQAFGSSVAVQVHDELAVKAAAAEPETSAAAHSL